jgi:TonB family protein
VIADLQGKIRANWDPPSDLAGGKIHRRSVQIQLTLHSDGSIRNQKLVQSSGDESVDESVMRAISTLKERIMPPNETLDFILDFNLY